MDSSLSVVLIILAGYVGLFILGKPRMDVVAVLALVLLTLTGVLDVPEALTRFSDPKVVLIADLVLVVTVLLVPRVFPLYGK